MENCFRICGDIIQLDIKAVPGVSKTEFAGIKAGRLRIRIAAVPEGGKANTELLSFLAKTLGCPRRDLQFISGEKSRLKTIAFPNEYRVQLEQILSW
ncbi:MAG: DUF167 domain-containing protein [Treponema sp.]|jgi:uncharacterized protein (TIGR00251 family)|nr:DUF167 domain-containing protein [Treponema sp.]